jgi:S1-C subfamily serine protease
MQNNEKEGKKWLITAAVVIIFGILMGGAVVATRNIGGPLPQAPWKTLADLWAKKALAPVAGSTSSTTQLYAPTNDYETAVIDAVQKAVPSVVSIVISERVPIVEQCPYNPFGDLPLEFQPFFGGATTTFMEPCTTGKTQLQAVGGGTGFIVSPDGLILTNKHVVAATNASYTVILNNGKKYPATVLARDPVQDFALVKIDATGLPTLPLGDSDGLLLGQTAIAIGNALGQFSNTVSVGVVSGLERTVTASDQANGQQETIQGVIQTDAAINPGNSGGPLLNLQGQVIGIDTALASGAQNIGFAIPINRAKHDVASVLAVGKIQSPFLGVQYLMVTPAMASAQDLATSTGALVRGSASGPGVEPNSPAAKAGIQSGDIIEKVDDQAIDANHVLSDVIENYSVGDTVTLTIDRGGKQLTIPVTLGIRPAGQ